MDSFDSSYVESSRGDAGGHTNFLSTQKKLKKRNQREEEIYGIFADDEFKITDDEITNDVFKKQKPRTVRFVSAGISVDPHEALLKDSLYQKDDTLEKSFFTKGKTAAVTIAPSFIRKRSSLGESDIYTEKRDVEGSRESEREDRYDVRVDENKEGDNQFFRAGLGSGPSFSVSPAINLDFSSTDSDESSKELPLEAKRFKFEDANYLREAEPKNRLDSQLNSWNLDKMSRAYGIGYKMMKKMGYKGGGLGRDGEGVKNPIEVRLRAKNRGLQDFGERIHANDKTFSSFSDVSSLHKLLNVKKKGDKFSKVSENWRKSAKLVQPQKVYKSAVEVATEGRSESLKKDYATFPVMRIIDMTGPQQRIIESLSDLSNWDATRYFSDTISPLSPLQRLMNEIELHVTSAESALKAAAQERKFEEDALIGLSHDHEKVSAFLKYIDEQYENAEMFFEKLNFMLLELSYYFSDRVASRCIIKKKQLEKYCDPGKFSNVYSSSLTESFWQKEFEVDTETLRLGSPVEVNPEVYSNKGATETQKQIAADPIATLKDFFDTFQSVSQQLVKSWCELNIFRIAMAFVSPLIVISYKNWLPTADPERGAKQIKNWEKFFSNACELDNLTSDAIRSGIAEVKPANLPTFQKSRFTVVSVYNLFKQSVEDHIVRKICIILGQNWSVREPDIALRICEIWQTVLPSSLFSFILSDAILPKITAAIDLWDPQLDPMPLNVWVHPWLPFLGEAMHTLWDLIIFKFSSCLQHWNPCDKSALAMLSPWKFFFDLPTWESLMQRCIIPKLRDYLEFTPIRLDAQVLDSFQVVFDWTELLSPETIAQILDCSFFSRWLQVLQAWVRSPTLDYGEVMNWYKDWKSVFPRSLLSCSIVRSRFLQALNIINRMTFQLDNNENPSNFVDHTLEFPSQSLSEGSSVAVNSLNFSNFGRSSVGNAADEDSKLSNIAPPLPHEPPPPTPEEVQEKLNLKDYLELLATSNDMVMKPKIGRIENGKQVYSFGRASIYIDKKVIFLWQQGAWFPVTVEHLIQYGRSNKK